MCVNSTSTRSVNSSIYEFVEEFGRTFHRYKEGSKLPSIANRIPFIVYHLTPNLEYYLPNDEVSSYYGTCLGLEEVQVLTRSHIIARTKSFR